MKSRCSFILRAGIALILCVLMLFGTMATSLAAVVDNSETGASWSTPAGMRVYLKCFAAWASGITPTFHFYTNNSGGTNTKVSCTEVSGSNGTWFYANVPDDGNTYTYVKVSRNSGNNEWNLSETYLALDNAYQNTYYIQYDNNYNYLQRVSPDWDNNGYGKIYFDRSTTNWTSDNIYFFIGTPTNITVSSMTKVSNTNDIYYKADGNWNGYTIFGFACGSLNSSYSSFSTFASAATGYTTVYSAYNLSGTNKTFLGSTYTKSTVGGLKMDWMSDNADDWTELNTISAKANSGANGTVTIDGYKFTTSGTNGATAAPQVSVSAGGNNTSSDLAKSGLVMMTATPAAGYDFNGWTVNSGTVTPVNSTSLATETIQFYATGDVELTAAYTPKTYTISYAAGANGSGTVDSTSKTHGTNATLSSSTFTRTGYTQTGWSTSDGGSNAYNLGGTNYSTEGDATLYPFWTANTYTITYKDQGDADFSGSHGSDYPTTHTYGSSTTLVDPSKDGYTFEGWYTDSDCTGTAVTTLGATAYTANITLYAKWAVAGTPQLSNIDSIDAKNVNTTSFTFPVDVTDRDKASGTLTLQVTSGDTDIITISGSPYTVSADTTNISASVAGTSTGTSTITVKLYDGSTLLDTKTVDITVSEPTFSIANTTIYANSSSVAAPTVTDGNVTPSSIAWSSGTPANVTINASSGVLTAASIGASKTSTITATATYACGYTKSATCTVTVTNPTLTIDASSTAGSIGTTTTVSATANNPGTSGIASYAWSTSDSSIVALSSTTAASPTLTFKKPGTATIGLTVTYNGTGLTKTNTNTLTITVAEPTVSFASSDAVALDVHGTSTNTATGSDVGRSASATLTYSGTNEYINVNSSTGEVTALKPTASAQTVTATYTVTCSGQETTVTNTYSVTVNSPTLSMPGITVAKGDSGTITATSTNPSDLTFTYALTEPVTGVSVTSAGEVTVASSCSASSASVTATANNSSGTAVGTIAATVTIEDPSVTSSVVADDGTLYKTTGDSAFSLGLTSNISDAAYSYSSSDTSVATVSSGTVTIVGKGTTTITVTATNASLAGTGALLTMGLPLRKDADLAVTGAADGATATLTFTLNVSEESTDVVVLLQDFTYNSGDGWGTAYIHAYRADGEDAIASRQQMTKIGTNSSGRSVYAYKFTASDWANVNYLTFMRQSDTNWNSEWDRTVMVFNGTHGSATSFQLRSDSDGHRKVDTSSTTLPIPQVVINDASVPLDTAYTMTATNVTENSIGKYLWSSDDTSIATVTADTGTTASTTVTAEDVGSSNITVKVFAANPTGWNLTYSDTTLPFIGSTDTATVTVTADDKTITYSAAYSDDGSTPVVGTTGGTLTVTNNDDSGAAVASGASLSYNTSLQLVADAASGYIVEGIYYSVDDGAHWTKCDALYENADDTATIGDFALNNNYTIKAVFVKAYSITAYNTYDYNDVTRDFDYVAAPPRKIVITHTDLITGDTSTTTYTYAIGTVAQRGEDNQYYRTTAEGTGADPETHYLYSSGVYYEGNMLRILPGDEVELTYSGLAASDVISGVFFNNSIRFTTEEEPDNLYTSRVYQSYTGSGDDAEGYGSDDNWGTSANPYTYLTVTTLFADGDYYNTSVSPYSTITGQTYAAAVDQDDHTVTWTAGAQNYLNIDLELASKKQLLINDNDYTGIEVEGLFNEGYYTPGAQVGKVGEDGTAIKVSLATSSDCTYYFDGNASSDNAAISVTAYTSADAVAGANDEIAYYLISGSSMPAADVNVSIGIGKRYTIALDSKMLWDSFEGFYNFAAVATITAAYTEDGVDHTVTLNSTGSQSFTVESGTQITFTASLLETQITNNNSYAYNASSRTNNTFIPYQYYSFVGWFSGTYSSVGDLLKSTPTYTVTPTANLSVVAGGVRDLYINGTAGFLGDGYTDWNGDNNVKMSYDGDGDYFYYETGLTESSYTADYKVFNGSTRSSATTVWQNAYLWCNSTSSSYYYGVQYGKTGNDGNGWISNNTLGEGYGAPFTFYYYPGSVTIGNNTFSSGYMAMKATYKWATAYVSPGRGVDVTNASAVIDGTESATFNTPTVTVDTSDASAIARNTDKTYAEETVQVYSVKSDSLTVTANPGTTDLEVQAFVVYNIDSKESSAVTSITKDNENNYTAIISVDADTKVYIVPVYKFTDAYISANDMESHTVFVSMDDIDKDTWGGLVAMYSWGTTAGLDSGGWPGQLMIPNGNGFYGELQFISGGLAGVTFNNYAQLSGSTAQNFIASYDYDSTISTTQYSGMQGNAYQTYDYREPISIIENINNQYYDADDMVLTFALKPGNKTSATIGNGAYNASFDFEYLTNRDGSKRVDLNGTEIATNPTASYYVVCSYTEGYKNGTETYDPAPGTDNQYSIDWYVYSASDTSTLIVKDLSAAYTDIESAMTVIANELIAAGYPVSGRSVKIAYENPKYYDDAYTTRYSGQWYADSVNTLVSVETRIGYMSDGNIIYTDSYTNGTLSATITYDEVSSRYGEEVTTSGDDIYAAKVVLRNATGGVVKLNATNHTTFIGWYDASGNKLSEDTDYYPTFNADTIYYAVYEPVITYRYTYTNRRGLPMTYSAEGASLYEDEASEGHATLCASRLADVAAKTPTISIFNKTITFSATASKCTLDDGGFTVVLPADISTSSYTLTVNNSDTISTFDAVSYGTAVDVSTQLVPAKQSDAGANTIFLGWSTTEPTYSSGEASDASKLAILSTQANFGMVLTDDTTIYPVWGTKEVSDHWYAYIDKHASTSEMSGTSSSTSYYDYIIRYRNGASTGANQLVPDGAKCGVIMFSTSNESYKSNLSTYITNHVINPLANSGSATSITNWITGKITGSNSSTSASASAGGGALQINYLPANSLNNLNRSDIVLTATDNDKYTDATAYVAVAYMYYNDSYVFSSIAASSN